MAPITLTHADLDTKKRKLDEVRATLKTEFFGIDRCIDSIMDSIQTWYLLPQIITRPPIVALWGMTGVGKTALVRSLVAHLGMTSRFLEVQMDGFSSAGSSAVTTIAGLLNQSGTGEGQQGIVLLDEFQRFRTVDSKGEDVKLERYPDVWMLLSDGRFPSDYSKLQKIVDWMDSALYQEDNWAQHLAEEKARKLAERTQSRKRTTPKAAETIEVKRERSFMMMPSEAKSIKDMLRLPTSIREIMAWPSKKVRAMIDDFLKTNENRPYDYSKCLIFVSGNLDEAFRMADSAQDCDTSADVFYQHTLKIGTPEIKVALGSRFRPEQIARLGNNHVVYPSLKESAYMSLIQRTCRQYVAQAQVVCDISFVIEPAVYQEIYDNSVYPAQGTRPVFTSIHKLFGSPLSDAILWALEHKLTSITIGLDIPALSLVFRNGEKEKRVKIDFELRARRKSRSDDFNALVAVHEAGHAVAYAALFGCAPIEVSINVASFKGGYNLYQSTFQCKEEVLNSIAVSMAGMVAEEMIFGQELRSTGCGSDVAKATGSAGYYVRRYAMDGYQAFVGKTIDGSCLEDVEASDDAVHSIVKTQREAAQTVLTKHRDLLLDLSAQLLKTPKMDGAAFVRFVGDRLPGLVESDDRDVARDYSARLTKALSNQS